MKHGPWTSGPRELLNHARDHLAKATDVDNRFAMISVDNAVELMVKTYLTLPRRVTGLSLTRREREDHIRYFSTALSALEGLAPERLSGVPLGEIEWFHQIRNQLYHDGNVITVERDKAQRYLKHAERLMDKLFAPKPADGRRTRRRITSRNKQYQQFFDRLRSALLSVDPNFTRAKAPPQSWWNIGIGRSGFSLTPNFTIDNKFRVELYIDTGNKNRNDAAFDQLRGRRAATEEEIGDDLSWDPLPDAQACRMFVAIDGTIDETDEALGEIIEWAVPRMVKFREVFRPLIKNLELEA